MTFDEWWKRQNMQNVTTPRDMAFAALGWEAMEKLADNSRREISFCRDLLRCHDRHWLTIGEAFGLCLGGVDGYVTDLHGNAALIIEHCLNVAERAKKEAAANIITLIRECNSSMCHSDIIDEIEEMFNPATQPSCCGHDSDCAVHNAPAFEPGACDCGKNLG